MSVADTSRTTVDAVFAGQRRRFRLRIGEIGELERLCGAGIGEIMVRLGSHRFRAADIRETVRLGLEGGGATEPEASALALRYIDEEPLALHLQLAADILSAAVSGVELASRDAASSGNGDGARSTDPATSPRFIEPEELSASTPSGSTA